MTDHLWFTELTSTIYDQELDRDVYHTIEGHQGWLQASRCLSQNCRALAFWITTSSRDRLDGETKLVYPQTGIRIPPPEGLEPEETELYKEAAAVAPTSPRAACALLRVLLEAFLKRYLTVASQPVQGKNLAQLIKSAVEHLDLSPTMKAG